MKLAAAAPEKISTGLAEKSVPSTLVARSCVLLCLVSGCYSASGPAPGDTAEQEQFWTTQSEEVRADALRREIRVACKYASDAEIEAVAMTTVRFGELLRDAYDLSRPPEHNNVAVALGVKERGRCHELAQDLYLRLRAMQLNTLHFRRVISSAGHPLNEHSAVVVTDLASGIETGVVLDLWRYAGKVRFITVAEDRQHQWIERARFLQ